MKITERYKRCHYVEVCGKWTEVGAGFAKFEEKKNPTLSRRQYFHESGPVVSVVGYSPEIEYELDALACGGAAGLIREITECEKFGADAAVRVLTVDMTDTSDGGAYPAICRTYSVAADKCGGGGELIYTGKLVCASEALHGVFVVQSGVFVGEVE